MEGDISIAIAFSSGLYLSFMRIREREEGDGKFSLHSSLFTHTTTEHIRSKT